MNKYIRLYNLYKVRHESKIENNVYYLDIDFGDGIKFFCTHIISNTDLMYCKINNQTPKKWFDGWNYENSYYFYKNKLANDLVNKMSKKDAKLLLRHLIKLK